MFITNLTVLLSKCVGHCTVDQFMSCEVGLLTHTYQLSHFFAKVVKFTVEEPPGFERKLQPFRRLDFHVGLKW